MPTLRFPWVWWSLGWLLVLAVAIGSLMPGALVDIELPSDKLVHGLAYGVLMLWFSGLYEKSRHAWVAVALVLMGLALDGLQAVTPDRSFDWLDVAANAGGILCGWLLALTVCARWCERLERLLVT